MRLSASRTEPSDSCLQLQPLARGLQEVLMLCEGVQKLPEKGGGWEGALGPAPREENGDRWAGVDPRYSEQRFLMCSLTFLAKSLF